ncbi:MAG: DUF4405 domain-containing protein [Planctomycetales bacterium]|nr:DUF4405 domain-containing protein [Planctomycetales bacterium]
MSERISKTDVNFWLDTFLLCVFLLLCWISVVLRYVFPPIYKSSQWTLWGLDYARWSDVHFVTLCVMVAGILLHVMLHWPWVCGVVTTWRRKRHPKSAIPKQDSGSRTLWGVGLLIVILNVLGLGIAAASLTIQSPPVP